VVKNNVDTTWHTLNWCKIEKSVVKLQARLAKAYSQGNMAKVAALQRIMVNSFNASLAAVNLTYRSQGKRTVGVDNKRWNNDEDLFNAALDLRNKNYNHKPYRRINIPKANGSLRPINLPTLLDRAMQHLYKLGLEPIADCTADKNSFGFRKGTGCHNAFAKCREILEHGAEWILECDIKSCFDSIDHSWLMANIPIEKNMLWQFLSCGYVENNKNLCETLVGIPQGGPISPILCNMTLDNMQKTLHRHNSDAVLVRYADDFIIASSKFNTLPDVLPVLESFLQERGLKLANAKTFVTSAEHGFDFLGCNIVKRNGHVLITPSQKNITRLLKAINNEIRTPQPQEILIEKVNIILRGWANYYRRYNSRGAFLQINNIVNVMLKQVAATQKCLW